MHQRFVVYAAWIQGGVRVAYTRDPALDRMFWREKGLWRFAVLTPPLPAMWADWAATAVRGSIPEDMPQTAFANNAPPRGWRRWLGGFGAPRSPGVHEIQPGQMVRTAQRALGSAGYPVDNSLPVADLIAGGAGDTHPGGGLGEPITAASLPAAEVLDGIEATLAGSILYARELQHRLQEQGWTGGMNAEACLQLLVLQGRINRWPGIRREGWGPPRCTRCGGSTALVPWDCATCGDNGCLQCEECATLGPGRACDVVYARAGRSLSSLKPPPISDRRFPPLVHPALSPAQMDASQQLAALVQGETGKDPHDKDPRDALVWAVCGAGKTEVSFAAVDTVIQRGGRVMYAIPRRDVVAELGPRMRTAFPGRSVAVLYGGVSEEERGTEAANSADLVAATTHQAVRFYRCFDLVVLDEVDAYPYKGSRMLAYAVERARAPRGQVIRMTATPGRDLVAAGRKGTMDLVTIPARHHGHALPEPLYVTDRSLDGIRQSLRLRRRPQGFSSAFLQHVKDGLTDFDGRPAPLLLFVPTVALAELTGRLLREGLARECGVPPGAVAWAHARDPDRDAKRARFREGAIRLMVATSILERGITVPGLNVLVAFADEERIFDGAALVQMAGRVGRTTECPVGKVLFVGGRITPAMRMAVEEIRSMNREAGERGFLRVGGESLFSAPL